MLANPLLRRGLVLLLIAGVGFGAIKFVKGRSNKSLGRTGPRTVNVVYAAVDISPQTILTQELLRIESVPEKEAGGYLTVKSLEDVNGYVTRYPIIRDYPIQKELIAGRIDELGIAFMVPPGHRAMVIQLTKEPNFYDMIKSSDRVDVVATYPTGTEPVYSRTIVTDALVLAVNTLIDDFDVAQRNKVPPPEPSQSKPKEEGGKPSEPPPPPPKNITLAVTPEDAVRIAVSNKAMLDVILRPREELGFGAPVAGGSALPTTGMEEPVGSNEAAALTTERGPGGTRLASGGTKGPKIALYDIAPPLKSLDPKKGGAPAPAQSQPSSPRPSRHVRSLPPAPRRTSIPPVTPRTRVTTVIPMTPVAPPLVPSAPSNTDDVQIFPGSNKSTVEVKRPRT